MVAVKTRNITKRFGQITAVDGIDLDVEDGECFGLLGPNGAGKTTLVKLITAVAPITGGEAWVAGMDVTWKPSEVKALIGVVPQEENLDPELSVLENLLVYARYFNMPSSQAKARALANLELFALTGRQKAKISELSSGMKRHLLIARAIINQPRLLVLDEPTIGLDPQTKHMVWEKLGVEFSPVETRELEAQLRMIDGGEAQTVAQHWLQEAKEVVEPSMTDVTNAARLFLALSNILEQRKRNAMTINCLELINLEAPPPCYAMSRLLDKGIYAGCEGDVSALLTMMLLGYLAHGPAFMGNVVWANPESNILKISHCVVPTKMAGFSQPPRRYTLRNYHGRYGVTAYVELDIGQEVTIARLARNLDKVLILQGELVDCRDTTACRTTLSVRVTDVRKFVRCALGNHHALVYGSHARQTKALSQALGISTIEV